MAEDKKGGLTQVPTPSSANGKVGPFTPGFVYNRGDIVVRGSQGYWVCIRPHVAGEVFNLAAGHSNDTWRYSLGPS